MDRAESREWLELDLLALKDNQVEEAIDLEYKRCASLQKTDDKKREVGKDVSAFANSDGGIIVYGMKEQEKGGPPEDLDEGFNPQEIPKEWLENVIHKNIQPRIIGLHINPVQLETQRPGMYAYVVTIPQGTTAHQAKDWRYYKRFNFQSVPMEDFEVRDVMNRQKHPLVEPKFSVSPIADKYRLNISFVNSSSVLARYIKLVFIWPAHFFPLHSDKGITQRPFPTDGEWIEITLQRTDLIVFPGDETPITEDDKHHIFFKASPNTLDFMLRSGRRDLNWKVFADEMPGREGAIPFEEKEISGLESCY